LLPSLSRFSAILPVIFFILFIQRNKIGGFWVIFFYCVASFIADKVTGYMTTEADRFYVFFSFTFVEYSLFALFLYLSLKEALFKYILLLSSAAFYIFAAFNVIGKKSEGFDSLTASVEDILIIIYSILFLFEQIKSQDVFYIYQSKKFWVVIAFLIYCSSTLFLFIYGKTFEKVTTYWAINNIFDIVKNLLFAVAFTLKTNYKQKYSLENSYAET
jgi:hypothetical protein